MVTLEGKTVDWNRYFLKVPERIVSSYSKRKKDVFYRRQFEQHIDYLPCKGNGEDVDNELLQVHNGRSVCDNVDEIFAVLEDFLENHITCARELGVEEALLCKDLSTSPGYPYVHVYATYGDMVKDVGFDEIVRYVTALEAAIIKGDKVMPEVFQVFSKKDKYSLKKIKAKRYRTIQCGSFFLLYLMKKYCGNMMEDLERKVNFFLLVTDPVTYSKRLEIVRNMYTVGVDYTGFDRSETSDLTRRAMNMFMRLAGVNVNIASYIVDNVVAPLCLTPTGMVVTAMGMNPSGQLFTSLLNSTMHLFYNIVVMQDVFCIKPNEYLSNQTIARAIMTGDDGIDGFVEEDVANKFISEIVDIMNWRFGIIVKVSLLEGKAFPKDILPTYLGKVEVTLKETDGSLIKVRVPAQPTKILTSCCFYTDGELKSVDFGELDRSVLSGIANEYSGFLLLRRLIRNYPVPSCVLDFWKLCEEEKIDLDLEGLAMRIHTSSTYGVDLKENDGRQESGNLIDQGEGSKEEETNKESKSERGGCCTASKGVG